MDDVNDTMIPDKVIIKNFDGYFGFHFVSRERAEAAYNKLQELWLATRVSNKTKEEDK